MQSGASSGPHLGQASVLDIGVPRIMSANVASPLRLCVPQPLDDHPFSIASSSSESDQKKRNSERWRALLDRSDSQEDMKANAKWQIL